MKLRFSCAIVSSQIELAIRSSCSSSPRSHIWRFRQSFDMTLNAPETCHSLISSFCLLILLEPFSAQQHVTLLLLETTQQAQNCIKLKHNSQCAFDVPFFHLKWRSWVGHRIRLFPTFLLNNILLNWASQREAHPKCKKKTLNFPPTSMNQIAKKTRNSLISKSTSQVEGQSETPDSSPENNACTIVLTKKKPFLLFVCRKSKRANSLNPHFRHQTTRRNHVQETTEENQQQQQ